MSQCIDTATEDRILDYLASLLDSLHIEDELEFDGCKRMDDLAQLIEKLEEDAR